MPSLVGVWRADVRTPDDESEALLVVEPIHGSCGHPSPRVCALRNAEGAARQRLRKRGHCFWPNRGPTRSTTLTVRAREPLAMAQRLALRGPPLRPRCGWSGARFRVWQRVSSFEGLGGVADRGNEILGAITVTKRSAAVGQQDAHLSQPHEPAFTRARTRCPMPRRVNARRPRPVCLVDASTVMTSKSI